jgi:hypothetical protein
MPKSQSRKRRPLERVPALPDLGHARTTVLNSLTSTSGQRTYDHAIREFVTWAVQSLVSHSTAPSYLVPDADLFTFELRRKTSGSRAPSEPDNLAIPRPPNRRSLCCYPHRILQGSS